MSNKQSSSKQQQTKRVRNQTTLDNHLEEPINKKVLQAKKVLPMHKKVFKYELDASFKKSLVNPPDVVDVEVAYKEDGSKCEVKFVKPLYMKFENVGHTGITMSITKEGDDSIFKPSINMFVESQEDVDQLSYLTDLINSIGEDVNKWKPVGLGVKQALKDDVEGNHSIKLTIMDRTGVNICNAKSDDPIDWSVIGNVGLYEDNKRFIGETQKTYYMLPSGDNWVFRTLTWKSAVEQARRLKLEDTESELVDVLSIGSHLLNLACEIRFWCMPNAKDGSGASGYTLGVFYVPTMIRTTSKENPRIVPYSLDRLKRKKDEANQEEMNLAALFEM